MARPPLVFVVVLFFLSGATSLVDQVVWLKYLSYVFGNTTQASAILLGVFMGGLAAGAWYWGRTERLRAMSPILLYGFFEGAIGLVAVLSPLFFLGMDQAYVALFRFASDSPALFTAFRVVLAGLFLFPPTFLMGGTLPLLARGFEVEGRERGRASGVLYAWNTVGALFGTLLATYALIPTFGLRATLSLSAAANFLIVLAVGLWVKRARQPGRLATAEVVVEPDAPPPPAPFWLALFFVVGLTSLAYEVVWTRILVFFLGSSVFAFGTMLAAILLGLSLGSALISPFLGRLRRPALALALLELGVALGVVLQLGLFSTQSERMIRIAVLLGKLPLGVEFQYAIALVLATVALLIFPTVCMGAAFPLAVRVASPTGEAGRGVGRVYAANTFGAIAGSLGAGFVLIPAIGTQGALLALAALNVLCAGAATVGAAREPGAAEGPAGRSFGARWLSGRTVAAVLLAICSLGGLALLARRLPAGFVLGTSGLLGTESSELLHFREDASCAVTVRRIPFASGPALSIEVNGVNVAGSSPDLVMIQKLQGHLPLLVHGAAKRVLHIGFGSGGTAYAVSSHPISSLTIAEISPAVLEASDLHFRSVNHGVLHDPRVRRVIADGRNLVLGTRERFDMILSDSIHPRYAGNGSLYTEDYFRLCRERLAPGGVISMWLPIYSLTERNLRQVVRAFVDVFPGATVWYPSETLNPFLIVLARQDDALVDVEVLRKGYAQPRIQRELAEIGYPEPADLLADLVVSGEMLRAWVHDVPPHVDDLPAVEYESGRVLSREQSWLSCFASVLKVRTGPGPALSVPTAEAQAIMAQALAKTGERTLRLRRQYAMLRNAVEKGGQPLQGVAATMPN